MLVVHQYLFVSILLFLSFGGYALAYSDKVFLKHIKFHKLASGFLVGITLLAFVLYLAYFAFVGFTSTKPSIAELYLYLQILIISMGIAFGYFTLVRKQFDMERFVMYAFGLLFSLFAPYILNIITYIVSLIA